MITRIEKALAERRLALKNNEEKGFTLIELLVVVIIIGILAAIAIPVYIGIQNNAKDSATKSDIQNAKTAVVAFFTNSGNLPTTLTDTGMAADGYPGPSQAGETLTLKPISTTEFCIEGSGPVVGNKFHATDSSGVLTGGCP